MEKIRELPNRNVGGTESMSRTLVVLGIFLLFLNCGFKPIYKLSENNLNSSNYSIEIINKVSSEINEEAE